jgi:hypothetical protein
MYSHLSYSVAQQHIDELRAGADRRRLVAQATRDRTTVLSRLMQIARVQRRPRAVSSGVTLSPNA